MQQISLAHDPDQPPLMIVNNWDSTDMIFEQGLSKLLDRAVRHHRYDRRDHDVAGLHRSNSLTMQEVQKSLLTRNKR